MAHSADVRLAAIALRQQGRTLPEIASEVGASLGSVWTWTRDVAAPLRTTLETRFWAKVEKGDGCWLWLGSQTGNGYGQLRVGDRRVGAHRIAYELERGPIPPGLTIDHLCKVRLCVRPDHLEAVTFAENVRRR